MSSRSFKVTLEEGKDGYYVAKCVEIPEAISQGKTKEEALKNIEEAIEAVLEWRQKKAKGKTIKMVEVTA
ncbi:MAG: type II toxin-antitoxin system HicB family antitoxin [archaeon]|nr:type II toxin-antitoxin system HicB family antitoxin [archaeon]